MFVKARRERSLMPQYHLADRGTQRKHASMKWQTERKGASEKRCSYLLTEKMRRESGWSGFINHQLKSFKESLHLLFDAVLECQTASKNNVLLKKDTWPQQDEQHNCHCQRKTANIWLIWSWWRDENKRPVQELNRLLLHLFTITNNFHYDHYPWVIKLLMYS